MRKHNAHVLTLLAVRKIALLIQFLDGNLEYWEWEYLDHEYGYKIDVEMHGDPVVESLVVH